MSVRSSQPPLSLEASYAFSVSSELALAKQLAGIAVGDQGVSYNRGLMRNRSKATSNSLLDRGCAVLECRCRPHCVLYDFIPWLKAMNQRTPRPPGAHASEDKRSRS